MSYRVIFDEIEWENPAPGIRCKIVRHGRRQLRLVEYAREMPPHWCKRGHIGLVLYGEMEIEFPAGSHIFRGGEGVFIPEGEDHRHRATILSEKVLAVFVEDLTHA